MGCIARLGCLVLLVILGVCAWFTRDRWLPERYRSKPPAVSAANWQPVTNAGAERTRLALDRLSQPRGPVFQALSAGDVASLAFSELSKRVSGAADSVAARIDGDRMSMRASVRTAELKGKLGPLAGMLRDREAVELTGTFSMLRPGLGAFNVQEAKLGRISLPQGMIPRLIKEVDRGSRPEGLPDTALPLPVPGYVSDIRIANGKVTLYKNVK
jgi:hypothetical protein